MGLWTIQALFAGLPDHFDADAAPGLSAIYQFVLEGEQAGAYHVMVRDRACTIREGVHPAPDVTLSMTAEDCLLVMHGRLNGLSAALSGRVRVAGDMGLALRLKSIFPTLRPSPS